MAYDDVLADRLRERLEDDVSVTEKRMFGGLSFLAGGNLLIAVRGDDLLVRVGPEGMEGALARMGARPAVMGSRTMRGWVQVAGDTLDDDVLDSWIKSAVAHNATLPPK